ncbi:MAG: OmpA family protein [Parvularculaceae bacterium]|nr:OmpA family protein [Parvularculaceae bacterium]
MRKIMTMTTAAIGAAALLAAGCTTNPYTGERRAGRVVTSGAAGAGAGAAAGAVIGAATGNVGKGAAVGAIVGAATGAGIGVYQDRQQAKLRERLAATGVSVTRQGDNIILNMPSDITFDTDRSDVKAGFYETLKSVALVLKEFNKTSISVNGHADSTGTDQHNLALSQRRAGSVADYLASQGVAGGRLRAAGFGESQPIADNNTADGRRQNRRVQIIIDPVESQFPAQ